MSKQALATVLIVCLAYLAVPASSTDKEILALEQNVSLLMGKVDDIKTAMNTQSDVIKSLIGSNTDTVNKMGGAVAALQTSLNSAQSSADQRADKVASSFQNVNDEIATLKSQLADMNQTLKQVQQLQQTVSAPPPQPQPVTADPNAVGGSASPTGPVTVPSPAAGVAPDQQAYKNALADYSVNNFDQAQSEFARYLRIYPEGDNVPDALYFLGTIFYGKKDYSRAVDEYSQVLDEFPNSTNAAQAELNKGMSLAMMGNKAAAIAEFKSLKSNYKDATEQVRLATEELNRLQPTVHH